MSDLWNMMFSRTDEGNKAGRFVTIDGRPVFIGGAGQGGGGSSAGVGKRDQVLARQEQIEKQLAENRYLESRDDFDVGVSLIEELRTLSVLKHHKDTREFVESAAMARIYQNELYRRGKGRDAEMAIRSSSISNTPYTSYTDLSTKTEILDLVFDE